MRVHMIAFFTGRSRRASSTASSNLQAPKTMLRAKYTYGCNARRYITILEPTTAAR